MDLLMIVSNVHHIHQESVYQAV